mmetsp:Transcript_12384/g.31681  ORF Transcript_12384/g.31681 Transcript_12384/m.31681 type:complete len:135 (-) Transcript_12384:2039-2443(-)
MLPPLPWGSAAAVAVESAAGGGDCKGGKPFHETWLRHLHWYFDALGSKKGALQQALPYGTVGSYVALAIISFVGTNPIGAFRRPIQVERSISSLHFNVRVFPILTFMQATPGSFFTFTILAFTLSRSTGINMSS